MKAALLQSRTTENPLENEGRCAGWRLGARPHVRKSADLLPRQALEPPSDPSAQLVRRRTVPRTPEVELAVEFHRREWEYVHGRRGVRGRGPWSRPAPTGLIGA